MSFNNEAVKVPDLQCLATLVALFKNTTNMEFQKALAINERKTMEAIKLQAKKYVYLEELLSGNKKGFIEDDNRRDKGNDHGFKGLRD